MNERLEELPAVVGAALEHESATLHVTGQAHYTDDIEELPGTLYAAIGMCANPGAALLSVELDPVRRSDGVIAVFTAKDIPGTNLLGIITPDEPLLAQAESRYWGQPLFLVVAESMMHARRAARRAVVEYSKVTPVVDAAEAKRLNRTVVPGRDFRTGDVDAAMGECDVCVNGWVRMNGQEHFYLEGQVAYAIPGERGQLTVHSATQHPSEMQAMIGKVLGRPSASTTVLCRRMGGAFGGKESQSYIAACLAALATAHTGRPVKLRLDRDDDFLITGKRHAFDVNYQLGASATGRLKAVFLDHLVNCGHSSDYSGPVADRVVFHATNTYHVEMLQCRSFRARTDLQSATAFRGFGGPQSTLAMECAMEHLAFELGQDPLRVRKANLFGGHNPSRTHFGQQLPGNVLPELLAQLEDSSEYWVRRAGIRVFNSANRILRKGLALMPHMFGVGFGATFLNQAGALIQIYTDGSIIVNHGGTEMGQGLNTKVAQVVAHELGVPLGQVYCSATDTSKVPNTVSTAASSGMDLNGMAACDAARTLRERLQAVAGQLLETAPDRIRFEQGRVVGEVASLSFAEVCAAAFVQEVSLSATGYYGVPGLAYDFDTMIGRPFHYYVYGAACAEVTIDTLTGELSIDRVDILQDAGRSINPALDRGQIEGGFVQGMGWVTTEELVWRKDGFLATHSPQTYKIPTSRDVPREFRVDFFQNDNPESTVHRSKAIGEPPLHLAVSVYLATLDAIVSAGGRRKWPCLRSPATPEAVLAALESAR